MAPYDHAVTSLFLIPYSLLLTPYSLLSGESSTALYLVAGLVLVHIKVTLCSKLVTCCWTVHICLNKMANTHLHMTQNGKLLLWRRMVLIANIGVSEIIRFVISRAICPYTVSYHARQHYSMPTLQFANPAVCQPYSLPTQRFANSRFRKINRSRKTIKISVCLII